MVTVTKTYNLEIKGNLFAFTEAEAKELFNALDSVLNNKTYPKLGEMIPVPNFKGPYVSECMSPDIWSNITGIAEKWNKNKFKL